MSTLGKVAWLITINNPEEHEKNPETLLKNSPIGNMIKYCKWACEEGEQEQTPHIHIYIHLCTQQRFSALKNIFPKAHIDEITGTPAQMIDYVGNPDFVYAETNPDRQKTGKRKGGICTSRGEFGSVDGIKLNKSANGGGKGVMESRLIRLKELIDAGESIESLWELDFYVMCRNLVPLNSYYITVNGVSLEERMKERRQRIEAERRDNEREVLREVYSPLEHW
jgi:hypothetical protein